MEPAGALALAGLKAWVEAGGVTEQRLAAVLSGANMNFDRLGFVAERAELGEGREALLAVTIPERPGAFREFCAALGRCVVTEFNYRLSGRDENNLRRHLDRVAASWPDDAERLRGLGYETVDLSANEMAKLHVRHMVGGHTPHVAAERVCRFEFPERPGALLQFLDALGGRWNISLFHYRNHGADFGRVLVAFEVPDDERPAFEFSRQPRIPLSTRREQRRLPPFPRRGGGRIGVLHFSDRTKRLMAEWAQPLMPKPPSADLDRKFDSAADRGRGAGCRSQRADLRGRGDRRDQRESVLDFNGARNRS